MRMMRRCDAEAGCCGFPLLPSEHLRPTSGFHPSAMSENNSPEHPETLAPSTSTKEGTSKPDKISENIQFESILYHRICE